MPRVKKQLKRDDAMMEHDVKTEIIDEGYVSHLPRSYQVTPATSFDTDTFLAELSSPLLQISKDSEEGELPFGKCPVCTIPLEANDMVRDNGIEWRYVRCPSIILYTKCFITCGVEDFDLYLDRVKATLHPSYRRFNADHIHPANMRCYCNMSLILKLSKSEKNFNRLYFKCPKGRCNFFQWGDSAPQTKVQAWFKQGVTQDRKGIEQHHNPYDLTRSYQHPTEARLRN